MTRVPKFRAWLKDDEEMIPVEDMSWDYRKNYELYFSGIGDGIIFWKNADDLEIMQSTGLKDKNGVEIFEGDIVMASGFEFMGVSVVRYEDSLAGFVVEFTDKSMKGKTQFIYQFRELEVIGNIYENPELLEEKNE